MISFGPRPLSDTTSHPGAGQAFIFQLSFFCTLQFLFPSCLIRISPDSGLKTSHNHTLGIDTCMVAFFFSFIFLIYHASAVPVTSPSPTVWSACLDPDGGRPLLYNFFHFLRMYWISDFKPASHHLRNREPTSINRRRQFWILAFLVLYQEQLIVDAACHMQSASPLRSLIVAGCDIPKV